MPPVGPGTMLGGRYALRSRLVKTARIERWEAHDSVLGRDVLVTTIAADDPVGVDALDAARRASAVSDPRLVRVLDAETQDGTTYIVEEADNSADTLESLLAHGPLSSREARRITAEIAGVLARVQNRGLHHQMLSPSVVQRTRTGQVRLRGLAVDAALAGIDDTNAAKASRADVVGTVSLLYAALTATWPWSNPSSDLTSSPRVGGRLVTPAELVPAVPADLAEIVDRTLLQGRGPATPEDLSAQVRLGVAPPAPGPAQQPIVPADVAAPVESAAVPESAHAAGATAAQRTPAPATSATGDIDEADPAVDVIDGDEDLDAHATRDGGDAYADGQATADGPTDRDHADSSADAEQHGGHEATDSSEPTTPRWRRLLSRATGAGAAGAAAAGGTAGAVGTADAAGAAGAAAAGAATGATGAAGRATEGAACTAGASTGAAGAAGTAAAAGTTGAAGRATDAGAAVGGAAGKESPAAGDATRAAAFAVDDDPSADSAVVAGPGTSTHMTASGASDALTPQSRDEDEDARHDTGLADRSAAPSGRPRRSTTQASASGAVDDAAAEGDLAQTTADDPNATGSGRGRGAMAAGAAGAGAAAGGIFARVRSYLTDPDPRYPTGLTGEFPAVTETTPPVDAAAAGDVPHTDEPADAASITSPTGGRAQRSDDLVTAARTTAANPADGEAALGADTGDAANPAKEADAPSAPASVFLPASAAGALGGAVWAKEGTDTTAADGADRADARHVERDATDETVTLAETAATAGTSGAGGTSGATATSAADETSGAGGKPDAEHAQPVAGEPGYQVPDDLRGDIEHPPSKAAVITGAALGAAAAGTRAAAHTTRDAAVRMRKAGAERAEIRRRDADERKAEIQASQTTFSEVEKSAAVDEEPIVPILAPDLPAATPSRQQAKFVVGLLAGFLAFALIAGILGIVAMVNNLNDKIAAPPVGETITVTAPAVTVTAKPSSAASASSSAASTSASATPSATGSGVPVTFASAAGFDPEGNNEENDARAPRAIDGDPATAWTSKTYKRAEGWDGSKTGVGLLLTLPKATTLNQITVDLGAPTTPGDVTIYTATNPSLDGATSVLQQTGASGTLTATVAPGTAPAGYVIVWFTKPGDYNGRNVASVAEVTAN